VFPSTRYRIDDLIQPGSRSSPIPVAEIPILCIWTFIQQRQYQSPTGVDIKAADRLREFTCNGDGLAI
jgi:hypothetical protein